MTLRKEKDKAALQRVLGIAGTARHADPRDGHAPCLPLRGSTLCAKRSTHLWQGVQFVVLGKGDAKYETFFEYAKQRYGGRMAVYLGYSEQLAMQIYAGADLFLMPSKSEPCGSRR